MPLSSLAAVSLHVLRLYFTLRWSRACLESTTIALLARLAGLLEPLRDFVKSKPVWWTCAGAILLAQAAEGMKKGGQELLGGMSVTVMRNGFGSQVWCSAYAWSVLRGLRASIG